MIIFGSALLAYRVNARRSVDDPKKRNYHLSAILLAPITWPFLLLAWIIISILAAFVYGIFLLLFTIALIAFRKPFILTWLQKTATWIGDKLLEANTYLIRIAFDSWVDNPQSS